MQNDVLTTCPSCGAPLAGDQRYCLNCGTRRPEARLEFLDVLDEDVRARSAPPVVQPHVVAPAGGRLQAHTGALALGSALLLTLLIGLLVGHWVTDRKTATAPAASNPAPQVIRVEGTGAPAASSDATTSAPASTTATPKRTAAAARTAKAPKGSVSVRSLTSKRAVDDAVKKGKPISTGSGRLPPKDDKPAGGGSSFESIG